MSMLDRLIATLDGLGLAVKPGPDPGTLLLTGPAAAKTPEVMAAVKAFKPELLARFGRPAGPPVPVPPPPPVVVPVPAAEPASVTCAGCGAGVHDADPESVWACCRRPLCPWWRGGFGPDWIPAYRSRKTCDRGRG